MKGLFIEEREKPVRGGFEPPVRFYPYNGLANRRIRPLCHRTRKGENNADAGAEPTTDFLPRAAETIF